MKGRCSITCVGLTLDLILTNSMNELACNGKRKASPLLQVHSEQNSGDVVGHRSRRSKLLTWQRILPSLKEASSEVAELNTASSAAEDGRDAF